MRKTISLAAGVFLLIVTLISYQNCGQKFQSNLASVDYSSGLDYDELDPEIDRVDPLPDPLNPEEPDVDKPDPYQPDPDDLDKPDSKISNPYDFRKALVLKLEIAARTPKKNGALFFNPAEEIYQGKSCAPENAQPPKYVGHLGYISTSRIFMGWAIDQRNPCRSISVDVKINGVRFYTGVANSISPLLRDLFGDDGHYGFQTPAHGNNVPDAVSKIQLYVAGTNILLFEINTNLFRKSQ